MKRIREQCGDMHQCELEQQIIKKHIRKQYREFLKDEMATVTSALPPTQSHCAVVTQEKGSSSWLSALPIEQQGFSLSKGQFWDAISLRYGWQLRLVPQKCCCGKEFEVNHVLTCKVGGFHTVRHNQLRDTIADLLKEMCSSIVVEPRLQPLTGRRFLHQRTWMMMQD